MKHTPVVDINVFLLKVLVLEHGRSFSQRMLNYLSSKVIFFADLNCCLTSLLSGRPLNHKPLALLLAAVLEKSQL